jgi:negative regulator of flagellin synthesis FlgM
MKVGDIKDTTAQMVQQYQRNDNQNQVIDKKTGNTSAPEEKVAISSIAKDINQLKNIVAKLPEIREEKVQELRFQIEKGNYNIDGAKIAEKMVGESLIDIFA